MKYSILFFIQILFAVSRGAMFEVDIVCDFGSTNVEIQRARFTSKIDEKYLENVILKRDQLSYSTKVTTKGIGYSELNTKEHSVNWSFTNEKENFTISAFDCTSTSESVSPAKIRIIPINGNSTKVIDGICSANKFKEMIGHKCQ